MAISFFPATSRSSRFALSRTSWACARRTSAKGVPRSMATATPSTNRLRAGICVLCANSLSAASRLDPARVCARISLNSRANSPREVRQMRSREARADSPAATESAIISASAGNSAISCFSRRTIIWPSHQSRARKPVTPPRIMSIRPLQSDNWFSNSPITLNTPKRATELTAQRICSARKALTV